MNNKNVAMPLKSKEGKDNEPAALKSRLGWTIYGLKNPDAEDTSQPNLQLHICECHDDIAIQKLCRYQLENDYGNKDITKQDLTKLQENVNRTGDVFSVGLLGNSPNITMPNNYGMALKRLANSKHQLKKNVDLKPI